jgi:hypothetical protein
LVSSHALKYNLDGDRSEDVERVDQAGSTGYLDQTSTFAYTPAQKLKSVTKTGADKGDNETTSTTPQATSPRRRSGQRP